jgi:hypothetical protein
MPAPDSLLPLILQIAIFLLPAGIAFRSLRHARSSIRQGLGPSRTGSTIFAVGTLIAIAIPGAQLLAGLRESSLIRLGFHDVSPIHDVSAAYALTLLALVSVVVGEELASKWRPKNRNLPSSRLSRLPTLDSRRTYLALLALGVLGVLLAPHASVQEAFANRGQSHGLGVIVTLESGIPVAVASAVLASHWQSRILSAVSALAITLFVIYTGERSPLLLVGVAVMIRILFGFSRARKSRWYVLAVVPIVYAGSIASFGIDAWRGAVIRGADASSWLSAILAASLNPFASLTAGGLGTLDGMTLAMKVNPSAIDATWTDALKAVTGFVPSQIWPSKPPWLGNIIAHEYTNFGGNSGIFISGPGYLYIILGGAVGVALGFWFLGFILELTMVRLRTPRVGMALLAYFLLRFAFAGDAFDLFLTESLFLVLVAGYSVGALAQHLWPKPASTGLTSTAAITASPRQSSA